MLYRDPIIKKYIDLFQASNAEIKTYYQGEPFKIPASNLPAVFITKQSTDVGKFSNAEDEHQAAYRLTLVTDVRKELNDEKQIVEGIAKLYDIMEGRDDGTYKLKSSSILNILRTNIAVDTSKNLRTDLSTTTRIDYGETLNRRTEHDWFVEAHIDWIAHYTQTR